VKAVAQAKSCGVSVKASSAYLGISRSSYYRYKKEPQLKKRKSSKRKAPPTPSEKQAVKSAALANPMMGYKRLTYLLQNEQEAGLKAHEVYGVLNEEGLIGLRAPNSPLILRKPEPPSSPNEVWHIDLMYLRVSGRWLYLVDIIDGYSRYLVHWSLNSTMLTNTVTMTVQEALEKWTLTKAPAMVHDSGTQFLSKEWRDFAEHHGMPNIRTRIAHPESNGLIERLHRTHRAEGLGDTELWTLERARQEMTKWSEVYNNLRPHFALHGLPPVVYHLGDPQAAIAQREHYVLTAAEARTNYWQQNPQTLSA
jgi:putative transposase